MRVSRTAGLLKFAVLAVAAPLSAQSSLLDSARTRLSQLEGEVVVGWDEYGYGYDHSYCLIFTKLPALSPAS